MKREEELTVSVKPLEWWEPDNTNNYTHGAKTIIGTYYVHIDGGRHYGCMETFVNDKIEQWEGPERGTLWEAQRDSQADYEARIRSALLHNPKTDVVKQSFDDVVENCLRIWFFNYDETADHSVSRVAMREIVKFVSGQDLIPNPKPEAEPVAQSDNSELLRALSRMAGNRQSDGTSSLVSWQDREAIINGCHDLLIASRQPPKPEATNEAAQITMGRGLVDVTRIDHEARSGILFRPRDHHIPVGEPGELQAGEYWPVAGDVVIWIENEGGASVIDKHLRPFMPEATVSYANQAVGGFVATEGGAQEKVAISRGRAEGILRDFDRSYENQKDNGPTILIPIIANYGDLALQLIRAALTAKQTDGRE